MPTRPIIEKKDDLLEDVPDRFPFHFSASIHAAEPERTGQITTMAVTDQMFEIFAYGAVEPPSNETWPDNGQGNVHHRSRVRER